MIIVDSILNDKSDKINMVHVTKKILLRVFF